MKNLIVAIIGIVAPLSVALIVFAQGMSVPPGRIVTYITARRPLLLRSLATTLVLVPAAALALILLLKPAPFLAVALAILVACPPAPLMLKSAAVKGGASSAFMACLHLLLATLAFLTVPATLYLMALPLGFKVDVDLRAMAWILARTILVPIGLGLAVRGFFPVFAEKAGRLLGRVGTIGLFAVVLLAVASLYPALRDMDLRSYATIALVSIVSLGIGHLSGPEDAREKTDLAVECGVRHPMLALTIAGATLSPERAMAVLVPCIVTFILMATLYLRWQGRKRAAG